MLPELQEKFQRLIKLLKDMKSAVLAYSGGVDSSFLMRACVISEIEFVAVTSISDTSPPGDIELAKDLSERLGVRHILIEGKELTKEEFLRNDRQRCFYCKEALFTELNRIKEELGYSWVIDGSTMDDLSDYRPGLMAGKTLGVRSPLQEALLYKHEIRLLSRELGLPTWDRPSSPCLSSRIPYGRRITQEALWRVKTAEESLKRMGFRIVRVRDYWPLAKIEVSSDEIEKFLDEDMRNNILGEIKAAGYKFVALDLEGYIQGKLNS